MTSLRGRAKRSNSSSSAPPTPEKEPSHGLADSLIADRGCAESPQALPRLLEGKDLTPQVALKYSQLAASTPSRVRIFPLSTDELTTLTRSPDLLPTLPSHVQASAWLKSESAGHTPKISSLPPALPVVNQVLTPTLGKGAYATGWTGPSVSPAVPTSEDEWVTPPPHLYAAAKSISSTEAKSTKAARATAVRKNDMYYVVWDFGDHPNPPNSGRPTIFRSWSDTEEGAGSASFCQRVSDAKFRSFIKSGQFSGRDRAEAFVAVHLHSNIFHYSPTTGLTPTSSATLSRREASTHFTSSVFSTPTSLPFRAPSSGVAGLGTS